MSRRKRIFQPQIFWDPSSNLYALKTPFSQVFIQELKTFCDHSPRFTGGPANLWLFHENDLATVQTLIGQHFPEATYGKVDFIPKPDPNQQRKAISNGKGSPAAEAALTMFAVGTYQDAKKIYSMLMLRWHPDREGGDANKAAQLTKAWQDLKTHMGWS